MACALIKTNWQPDMSFSTNRSVENRFRACSFTYGNNNNVMASPFDNAWNHYTPARNESFNGSSTNRDSLLLELNSTPSMHGQHPIASHAQTIGKQLPIAQKEAGHQERAFSFENFDIQNVGNSRTMPQSMSSSASLERTSLKRARSFDGTLALASPPKKFNSTGRVGCVHEQMAQHPLAETSAECTRHSRKRFLHEDGDTVMDIDGHTAKICKSNGFLDDDDDDVLELEPVVDINASQSSHLHGIDLFTASSKHNALLNLIDDEPIESEHSLFPVFKQVSVYPPAMKMLNRNALVDLRRFADGQLPKSTALLPAWMCKNALFAPQRRVASDGDLMEQEHSSVKIEELMDDEAMVEDFKSNVRLGVD